MTFRLRGTLVAAVATGELLHPDEVPMPDPFLLQNEQFVQPVGVVPAPVQPVAVLNPAMVDNAEDGELVAEEDGNAPVVVRGDVPPPQQVMAPIVAHQPLVVKGITYFDNHKITAVHWENANIIAKQHLLLTLDADSPEYSEALKEDYVYTLWQRYRQQATYSVRLRKHALLDEYKRFKQGSGEGVLAYEQRLSSLIAAISEVSENRTVFSADVINNTFSSGLLPAFQDIVERLETDGIEDRGEMVARCVRRERKLAQLANTAAEEDVAMVVRSSGPSAVPQPLVATPATPTTSQSNGRRGGGRRNRPVRPFDASKHCKHCNRAGHSTSECQKLSQFISAMNVSQKILYLSSMEEETT